MGERWKGLVHPYCSATKSNTTVMASLCCQQAPSKNAIFFVGDRVESGGNPLIHRLSQLDNIASVIVSKLGPTVNAWVVEPSHYCSTFACYHNLVPSLSPTGEPMGYHPQGLPAASRLLALLHGCIAQIHTATPQICPPPSATKVLPTLLFGFSKGGLVLNQLLAELAHTHQLQEQEAASHSHLLPSSVQHFLGSIREIHYVDVGLNCRGAYLTDPQLFDDLAKVASTRPDGLHITLHGTPRQWKDVRRRWIGMEKDRCLTLLHKSASSLGNGNLHVRERFYFSQDVPTLQMHFQIIEALQLSPSS